MKGKESKSAESKLVEAVTYTHTRREGSGLGDRGETIRSVLDFGKFRQTMQSFRMVDFYAFLLIL